MTGDESQPLIDDRFEILSRLGEGGMGVVYEAKHRRMDRTVALKVLKTVAVSGDRELRFKREAQVISSLDHPHIVSVYSIGVAQTGSPYIAMEYLRGMPLSQIIKEEGSIPWRRALPLFVQSCSALEHAHGKGVIHRDVKPSNMVVLDTESNNPQVKLVDFGIAKVLTEDDITRTSMVVGSAFYLSPGQCEGRDPSFQSDIYSLGCSLFETLSGRPPFVSDFYLNTMMMHRDDAPPTVKDVNPNIEMPEHLQSVIDCCLEKNVLNRYETTGALREDLERLLNGHQPVNIPDKQSGGKRKTKASPVVRRRMLIGVGCAIALCAILLATYILTRNNDIASDSAQEPPRVTAFDLFNANREGSTANDRGDYEKAATILLQNIKRAHDAGAIVDQAQAAQSGSVSYYHLGMKSDAEYEPQLAKQLETAIFSTLTDIERWRGTLSVAEQTRLYQLRFDVALGMARTFFDQKHPLKDAIALSDSAIQALEFTVNGRYPVSGRYTIDSLRDLVKYAVDHDDALTLRVLRAEIAYQRRVKASDADISESLQAALQRATSNKNVTLVEKLRKAFPAIKTP